MWVDLDVYVPVLVPLECPYPGDDVSTGAEGGGLSGRGLSVGGSCGVNVLGGLGFVWEEWEGPPVTCVGIGGHL